MNSHHHKQSLVDTNNVFLAVDVQFPESVYFIIV